MPGLDRTGPSGRGPMTGGARGLCNPYGSPREDYTADRPVGSSPMQPGYPMRRPLYGRARPRWGLGRVFGRGRGRGRRGR